MSTATKPGTHHRLTPWQAVAAPTTSQPRTAQTPRGFQRVKLALTQPIRQFPLVKSGSLGERAGMAGHDGSSYSSCRSRTSAQGTPEAPLQAATTRPEYDIERGISGHLIADIDEDSRHTIAAAAANHSAGQWYYPPECDLKWRPGRLDAIMAAAAIGIGIVSGLTAGSAMWWATGEHPHLAAFGGHLHHGSPRS
ncbi:Uncharacterised protein [Mycobacteroides abscessus subsp. bolletii]|uniref:hypothetical protein n=1 Tax=Mycobacteroides abscessus TaxID=36809 RepID=UPI0009A5FF86|nr:hypothetical protein [Mycobacteroides abscessus]SKS72703.1 Uncharacterised protein [Mycobacteroides abscessus subsp. bolletii]SKS84158.1 Uncharacterised protein [Mycobacteroides abscessus subsp. bolletii]